MSAPQPWRIGASDAKHLIAGNLPLLAAIARGERPRRSKAESAAETAAMLRAKGARNISEDNLELAMWIGDALEPTHQSWFTRKTGLAIAACQQQVPHPTYPLRATLDGVVLLGGQHVPFEGKTTSAHTKLPELVEREAPQLQAQLMCLGTDAAVLSVLWRTPKWEAVVVEADDVLQAEILDRLDLLALHMEQGTAPPALPPFPIPPPTWRPLAVASAPMTETADHALI